MMGLFRSLPRLKAIVVKTNTLLRRVCKWRNLHGLDPDLEMLND